MVGNYFDLDLIYDGEDIRATGLVTKYYPATGPNMDHAGGDPAEGGEIEDLRFFRNGVEIEDHDGEMEKALEDDIRSGAAEE